MTASSNSSVVQRLGVYLAAAGGSGLVAGVAGAAVVEVTDPNANTTIEVNNTSNGVDIDIDGGGYDISFTVYDSGPGNPGDILIQGAGTTVFHVSQRGTCVGPSPYYAGNVAAGSTIDASLFSSPTPLNWGYVWDSNRVADCNNFVTNEWGYLAYRLGTAPNYQYGYLKVRRRSGSNILDIAGGAYESTANVGITANGNGGPVNVPVGPAVPIGVSLLIAGAAALRHRRQSKTH